MMKKKIFLASFILLINYHDQLTSQEFSAANIPSELMDGANAVVREEVIEVIIEDVDKLITKKRRVVTVLNKAGHLNYGSVSAFYDDDTKIQKLSAVYYDAIGVVIKKYNKNKFIDVSAVSEGSLYEESRVKYLDFTPTRYPYTVEFELEEESKTTGFIPKWRPLGYSFYLGVESSIYKLVNNTNSEVRVKEFKLKDFSIVKEKLENGFVYRAENLNPIQYESYAPSLKTFTPELKVALTDFALKGVRGYASNWVDFGKWMHEKLIRGRDNLSEETKATIKTLVLGVEDPIEKAKIIYEFFQNKTRYISVQVGIGGWEPIAANQVDEVGYGDCKGLTNYMKALLDVAGVTSYYAVVHANEQFSIDENFASIEGNHVILNIPNGDRDIWLECTSQSIPFGFLGDFTDNRKVLVVTPEGGIIKKTSSYLDEDNFQYIKANVFLNSEGTMKSDIFMKSTGIQYDGRYPYLINKPEDKLKQYYKRDFWPYLNNLRVTDVEIQNVKDSIVIHENLKVIVPNYLTITGNEALLKLNVFNRNSFVPKRYRKRQLEFVIPRGYLDKDEYVIHLPEDYRVQGLLPSKHINSKFGTYNFSLEQLAPSTLKYTRTFLLKAGEYSKTDYAEYRKFRKTVAKLENLRISMTKKS